MGDCKRASAGLEWAIVCSAGLHLHQQEPRGVFEKRVFIAWHYCSIDMCISVATTFRWCDAVSVVS